MPGHIQVPIRHVLPLLDRWPLRIVFTMVLGFVLVFRASMAYQRFWGGRDSIENMTSQWIDAAIKCVSFDKRTNLPAENIRLWRIKIVSLFSLLHAAAINNISEESIELEVIGGLDEQASTQMNLASVRDEVYLVYSWIQVNHYLTRHLTCMCECSCAEALCTCSLQLPITKPSSTPTLTSVSIRMS